MRILTVSGRQLPSFKRLVLTFSYTPALVDPMETIVSSPIPSTAFGALLDTSAATLVINIVATSTATVSDGAPITVIRVPGVSPDIPLTALHLSGASCTDAAGNTLSPAIGPAPVGRDHCRSSRYIGGKHGDRRGVFSLNGRIVNELFRTNGWIPGIGEDGHMVLPDKARLRVSQDRN